MAWFRIDNRLVHGQIIERWLPYTRAARLIVCNDSLAVDALRQQIMLLAVPSRIRVDFVGPAGLAPLLDAPGEDEEKVLVILADCADAKRAYDAGVHFTSLNIGNLHYSAGKRQICGHVALSDEDSACLRALAAMDVTLDFRCVPDDAADIQDW
jgi:PTS system mannose-specific IIB component